MRQDPIVIELRGHVAAKKNNWRPRKGGGGIWLDKSAQESLDRLALQIPGSVRDLRLESPDITFCFTYHKANWDRDNAATSLLDLLVKYGVIANDNLARCNGRMVIEPAERADYDAVKIILIPRAVEEPSAPRYVDPRRRRLAAQRTCPACGFDKPEVCETIGHTYPIQSHHVDELEDIPEGMEASWQSEL